MNNETFKAMIVQQTEDQKYVRTIGEKSIEDLPAGDVLIKVKYSSLNYKDALVATGARGLTRSFPHTPGIDAAGIVVESQDTAFQPNDEVVVTGFDLGVNTSGGFGEYIRVPADWVMKCPPSLSLKDSMLLGTAGLAAGLSVYEMEVNGLAPDQGEVLVTGASGGVGSIAVSILAKAGYTVVAGTTKPQEVEFLKELGANEIIGREAMDDDSGKPILKPRWAGVVDVVGGNILTTAIKSTHYRGCVSNCGMVAGNQITTSIFPFLIKGIKLLGIDTVLCPMDIRLKVWEKMASVWKNDQLAIIASECSLEDLNARIDTILKGQLKGRTIVALP